MRGFGGGQILIYLGVYHRATDYSVGATIGRPKGTTIEKRWFYTVNPAFCAIGQSGRAMRAPTDNRHNFVVNSPINPCLMLNPDSLIPILLTTITEREKHYGEIY